MSKYGVFSAQIYSVNPNTGKYGPEKTPYVDTFQTMKVYLQTALSLPNRLNNKCGRIKNAWQVGILE